MITTRPVSKYTKSQKDELATRDILANVTTDQLTQAYMEQRLSIGDYNYWMREKARLEIDGALRRDGLPMAIWKETTKNTIKAWNDLLIAFKGVASPEAANENKTNPAVGGRWNEEHGRLYYASLALYREAQMAVGWLNAIGDVSRQKIENMALNEGASVGLARIYGIIGEHAIPFPLVGFAFKGFGTAVKLGAKVAGKEAQAAKVVSDVNKESLLEIQALKAVSDGAQTDGVKEAPKVLKEAGKVVGKEISFADPVGDILPGVVARQGKSFSGEYKKNLTTTQVTMPSAETFHLPPALRGAKPRYNYGTKEFLPEFENDFEKTLYIVAQKKLSKQDAAYMQTLKNFMPNISEAEFRAAGREIRDVIKGIAKSAEPGVLKIPSGIGKDAFQLPNLINNGLKRLGVTDTPPEILASLKTPQELYAYIQTLESSAGTLQKLARQALKGDDADKYAFAKYASDLFTASPGQKIRYNAAFMDLLAKWDPLNVANGNIIAAMETLARDIAVQSNRNNTMKFIMQSQDGFVKYGTIWPSLRELYLNLLLPFSLVPSFVGNSIAVSNHVMERATGSLFRGDTSLRSTVHFAKGMEFATMDAVKAFGDAYRRMDAGQAAKFVAMHGSRLDYIPHQIPGTIGQIINGIGTSPTMGMDNLFKVLIRRGLLYETAADEAYALGLTGKAVGSYVQTKVKDPAFFMAHAAEWEARAKTMTYQGELGYFMKHLQPVMQWGPGVLYFPFVKTGVNLMKYSWDRTPGLQLLNRQLYKDIAAGGAKGDEAIGRLILSNLFGHMQFELAKDGYITGSGPLDPKIRGAWLATHEPYAAAIPGGWVPFGNLDPMTASMSFIADFAQMADQLNDVTGGKLARAAATAMVQNFPNKTWWRNMSDIQDQIKGVREGKSPSTYSEQVIGAPLITGVTGGAVSQRLKQIVDPIQRDTRTLMDLVKARVPYFSKDLPPKTDDYGDPLVIPQTMGSEWFGILSPVAPKFKPATEDPVKQEGDRLHANLPKFSNTVGGRTQHTEDDFKDFDILPIHPGDSMGVDLTPQQKYRWKQIWKEMWSDPKDGIKTNLLDTKEYNDPKLMPQALQNITYEGLMRKYKQAAWNKLLTEDLGLLERVVNAKVGNEIQKLGDPKERAHLQQDLQLTISGIRGMSQTEKANMLNRDHTVEERPAEQPTLPPEITEELH